MSAFDSLVNVLAALRDKPMAKSLEMPWPPGTRLVSVESVMQRAEPAATGLSDAERRRVVEDVMSKALRLQKEGRLTAADVIRLDAHGLAILRGLS